MNTLSIPQNQAILYGDDDGQSRDLALFNPTEILILPTGKKFSVPTGFTFNVIADDLDDALSQCETSVVIPEGACPSFLENQFSAFCDFVRRGEKIALVILGGNQAEADLFDAIDNAGLADFQGRVWLPGHNCFSRTVSA